MDDLFIQGTDISTRVGHSSRPQAEAAGTAVGDSTDYTELLINTEPQFPGGQKPW